MVYGTVVRWYGGTVVRYGGTIRWYGGTVRWYHGMVRWYHGMVRWYHGMVRWYDVMVRCNDVMMIAAETSFKNNSSDPETKNQFGRIELNIHAWQRASSKSIANKSRSSMQYQSEAAVHCSSNRICGKHLPLPVCSPPAR